MLPCSMQNRGMDDLHSIFTHHYESFLSQKSLDKEEEKNTTTVGVDQYQEDIKE